MTEQNSGHKNINGESPIPIPPVDQAWQSMQQKLDVELPVVENLPARSPIRHLWIKVIVPTTTVVTITAALWLYNHKHPENTPSSENIVSDTNLVVTSPDTQADSLTNTISAGSSSSATSGKSDINNNNPIPASSSSSQLLSPSPQSAKSTVSSQPVVTDKQYTGQRSIIQSITKQQMTRQQAAARPTASGKEDPVEKTSLASSTEQESLSSTASDNQNSVENKNTETKPTTDDQQQPVKFNTYTSNRSAAATTVHQPLQLSLLHTPDAKYNTSLLHKADLLIPRQIISRDKEQKWALYSQLNIPVPLYGDSIYFMGPNGKDQSYRNLIPVLRVERKLWKGALSLDVLPAVSAALNSSLPVKDSGAPWFPFDTSQTFLKQYGWGLALQYQFLVHGRWQVGAGIQTSFLQKAVIYQTVTDTFGHGTSGIYPATPADKQDLSKVRINGLAELNYVAGKWQLGIRALVPVTRVSKTKDISARPLNLEFVIRRRLWTK